MTRVTALLCFLTSIALTLLISLGHANPLNYMPAAIFLFVGLLLIFYKEK